MKTWLSGDGAEAPLAEEPENSFVSRLMACPLGLWLHPSIAVFRAKRERVLFSLADRGRQTQVKNMTSALYYTIKCPQCQVVQEVQLHETVNSTTQPELKAELMKNELNLVSCEKCELSFVVDKNLFYTDPERRIFIFYMPSTVAELHQVEVEFEERNHAIQKIVPGDIDAPEIHLVIERAQLTELIFMFEEEMNHRIIEYIKYQMYVRNMEQLDPMVHSLLFNAQDSTDEVLIFLVRNYSTGQFEGVLEYPRDAYNTLYMSLGDQNDDQAAMLVEMFPGPHVSARVLMIEEDQVEDV